MLLQSEGQTLAKLIPKPRGFEPGLGTADVGVDRDTFLMVQNKSYDFAQLTIEQLQDLRLRSRPRTATEVMEIAIGFLKETQIFLVTDPAVSTSRTAANLAICKLAEKLANEKKWPESIDRLWDEAISAVDAWRRSCA